MSLYVPPSGLGQAIHLLAALGSRLVQLVTGG